MSSSHHSIPRRTFINTLCGAAGYLTFRSLPAFASVGRSNASPVALTSAGSYDRQLIKGRVQHLFESLGGISDLFSQGDTVAIKINLTGGSGYASDPKLANVPIQECMWTHPEVLRAVTELIIDCGVRPGDITFVESLWDWTSFDAFGYREVQQYLGVHVLDLNSAHPYGDFVDLPVGTSACYYNAFRANQILRDTTRYVSIPKLKDHYEAGFTGSLKNQVGMVPMHLYVTQTERGWRAGLHHDGGPSGTHLPKSVCDLNLARPVDLAVIDGVRNARGGEGVWNPTFQIAHDNILLGGKDPVATDAVSAAFIGHDPESSAFLLPGGGSATNHLKLLGERGAGSHILSNIALVGDGASLLTSADPRQEVAMPEGYILGQNYPNPFNPTTMIRFSADSRSAVTLTICNSLGQEITRFEHGEVDAGVHQQTFDASHLPSGPYFYRLEARSLEDPRKVFTQTRKMVLVK